MNVLDKLNAVLGENEGSLLYAQMRESIIAEGAYCRFDVNMGMAGKRLEEARNNVGRLYSALRAMKAPQERLDAVARYYEQLAEVQAQLIDLRRAMKITESTLMDGGILGSGAPILRALEAVAAENDDEAEEQRCQACHFTVADCRCGKDDTDGAVVHEVS